MICDRSDGPRTNTVKSETRSRAQARASEHADAVSRKNAQDLEEIKSLTSTSSSSLENVAASLTAALIKPHAKAPAAADPTESRLNNLSKQLSLLERAKAAGVPKMTEAIGTLIKRNLDFIVGGKRARSEMENDESQVQDVDSFEQDADADA